jgi:hypothetical protein
MCGFVQLKSTWGQVSIAEELHIKHVMDRYKTGPKNNCLRALSIYWLYRNLRRQEIWESVIDWCS